MSRTIKCTNCDVALNLPAQALGRRLKCPKCGVKFHATETQAPKVSSNGKKTGLDLDDFDRPSTLELSRLVGSRSDLPAQPSSPGDLLSTFTLPMLTEADTASAPARGKSATAVGFPDTADASNLFKEDAKPRKRPTGAEGRAQARRCPTCGGVVPVGMSICQRCGLDLDTGMRVDLLDDLSPASLPSQSGVPILIGVIGGLCLALSLALAIFALVLAAGGNSGSIYFVPIAIFGGYASVQFLRRKAIKPLLVALTLGATINLFAMVAMPIYNANQDVRVVSNKDVGENPDLADEVISSPLDQLDTRKVTTGFVVLAAYAGLSVALLSTTINKNFRK